MKLYYLPGACSLGFMAIIVGSGSMGDAWPLAALWLVCFAVSFGGIMLIRRAIIGDRRAPSDPPA